ncbi:hypothetical protein ACYOEI_12815 [Singulisphaera rosea]
MEFPLTLTIVRTEKGSFRAQFAGQPEVYVETSDLEHLLGSPIFDLLEHEEDLRDIEAANRDIEANGTVSLDEARRILGIDP